MMSYHWRALAFRLERKSNDLVIPARETARAAAVSSFIVHRDAEIVAKAKAVGSRFGKH